MSVMTIPDAWYVQDRTLTVEDMESMPDDEFRYELDDGVLIVSPAPSRLHQLAVTRLAVTLYCGLSGRARGARGRRRQHQRVPAPGAGRRRGARRLSRYLLRGNPTRGGGGGRLAPDAAL